MIPTGKGWPSKGTNSDNASLEYSSQDIQIIVTPPKNRLPPDPDKVEGWDELSTQDISNMNDQFNNAQLDIFENFEELTAEEFLKMEEGIIEIEDSSKPMLSESVLEEFDFDFGSQGTEEKTETLAMPPSPALMDNPEEVPQTVQDPASKEVISQREGASDQVTIDEVLLLINEEDESSPVQCCQFAG